jgi:hypothetical protein
MNPLSAMDPRVNPSHGGGSIVCEPGFLLSVLLSTNASVITVGEESSQRLPTVGVIYPVQQYTWLP